MDAPDVDAFAALVRDCAGLVLTVLTRAGCPDPEDVAQETFTRAYVALRRRPDTAPTRAWLVTIALNVRRNELRRLARHASAPLLTDPPAEATDRDLRVSLDAALARLPEAQRVPVVLRHVAGLPYDDVAVALGRPVGTVKSQVSRGLAALRISMEGTPA